jgi:hypothetical protein
MPKTKKKESVKYQWVKGENQGTVETYKETEGKFLVFESDRRCNTDLLGEFMLKIDIDNPVLQFEDPIVKVQKPELVKVNKPVEPKVEKPIKEESHVIPLIEMAKKDKTKLNVRLEIELPKKTFIKVMEDSFNDDILEVLSEYIVSKIEDPKKYLINSLKGSISEWYKYNNKTQTDAPKRQK